jgi:DNA-binding transcriptional LysR family regulator
MEIGYLKEFIVLAENCNYLDTAETLNISQSSLSKHIQKVESELGVPLFDRTTRSVSLNSYGKIYLPYAKTIVQQQESAIENINKNRESTGSTLSIGFAPMLGQYGLVESCEEFSLLHPEIACNTFDADHPADYLISGKCDFVFERAHGISGNDFFSIPFITDHLTAVFPDAHPLAKKTFVTITDLRNEKFIMHSDVQGKKTDETQQFLILCHNAGFDPKVVSTVSHTSNMVRMAAKGLGVIVINRTHIPPEIAGVTAVDIHPFVTFQISAFYLKKKKLSASARQFRKYVENYSSSEKK